MPPDEGRLILLVEDNFINQRVGVKMLEKEGFRVKVAVHGIEALEMVEAFAPDLVLMDLQMPIMNGFEATVELRKREAGTARHLPIVAVTANVMKGDKERCLSTGMDGYISKPIDRTSLVEEVNRLLQSVSSPSVL